MANAIAYDWDIDLALSADHVDPEIELEESFWAFHLEPEDLEPDDDRDEDD